MDFLEKPVLSGFSHRISTAARDKWNWLVIVLSQISALRGVNKMMAERTIFLKGLAQKIELPKAIIASGMHWMTNADIVVTNGAHSMGTILAARIVVMLLNSK
jgi:hypothetical protein